jgi:PAS domain S-box-containing protein
MEALRAILVPFYESIGIGLGLFDLHGACLIEGGWQNICTKFHRVHHNTLKACVRSDTELAAGVDRGDFRSYRCHLGLRHVVTPLFVQDEHVGNLFIGQFLYDTDSIDTEIFRTRAQACGFELSAYMEALAQVPRLDAEKAHAIMRLLMTMIEQFLSLSVANLQLKKALVEQKRTELQLMDNATFLVRLNQMDEEMRSAHNLEALLKAAVEAQRDILQADCACLIHPIDLDAQTWTLAAQSNSPHWPAILEDGAIQPMLPDWRDAYLRETPATGLVLLGPGYAMPVPESLGRDYFIKSAMIRVVYPAIGGPWLLDVHQCSSERLWSEQAMERFAIVASHIEGALYARLYLNGLRESEERFRNVVEQSSEVITVCDRDGRLLLVNQQACNVLGYTRGELMAMRISALDASYPDRSALEALWGMLPTTLEKRYRRKDGGVCPMEIRLSRIEIGGRDLVLGVGRDITERRRMENAQHTAEKMAALRTLSSGIAHDFNNILGAVRNLAMLAREEIESGNPARADIARILDSTDVGTQLVKQIMAICRPEHITPEAFSPGQVVCNALNLLRPSLPPDIAVDSDIAADTGIIVGDIGQYHQIVLNLLTNAIDAMAGGPGVLTIRLALEELDAAAAASRPVPTPGAYVSLTVADTGPGIPPENLRRIFEPFFTTKAKGKGTGLGLAIVHGVVVRHKGAIIAENNPTGGAAFTVCVPVNPEDQPPAAPVGPKVLSGAGHVLLVDDDQCQLQCVERILERLGYTVTACQRPRTALDALRRTPHAFDVLVSDLMMPELSGEDLARAALALRPALPVIICTGYGEALPRAEAKRIGVWECLQKPVDWERISHTLARLACGKEG